MARFGLLCLFAAALGSVAASPSNLQQFMEKQPSTVLDKKWDWTDCGSSSHIIHIKSIQVSPDPPQRGEELTITVEGDADETIEDGAYADVTVKVGVIKILSKEFDICEEADKANTTVQCPVQKGTHKVIQSVELPKEIPPAQFKVNIRAYTVDDEDLACMDLMMDFRPNRGLSMLNW
ncbi:sterol transporter [Trametes versicolor FP-101664 SS1]|uniref:sterol transporter n=1 Tax=Trametes versicolor (strain FP-101664) TaxID=717944 RepID=UPI000462217A|nr:sterol transporter [Trametes versicolor FP-101664 SS1]EIW64396.1 hypothetical protein TRAVEDRAFT_25580 [Trametes versicolor FP-101664 SS1]